MVENVMGDRQMVDHPALMMQITSANLVIHVASNQPEQNMIEQMSRHDNVQTNTEMPSSAFGCSHDGLRQVTIELSQWH